MLNEIKVTLRGRVGTDVKFIDRPGAKSFATFRLAVTPYYRSKEGEWCNGQTEWISAKAWGTMAQNIYRSIMKGDAVLATGVLRSEVWEDKDKITRHSLALNLESIGHDLSFGRSIYKANTAERQAEQQAFQDEGDLAGEGAGEAAGAEAAGADSVEQSDDPKVEYQLAVTK